jgi:endonuclease/exonuclease/phosphatase family metal-dependent hydrolase
MAEVKIATFNVEWMVSVFGAKWKDWKKPGIPKKFAGKNLGGIRLEPIEDVKGLCRRLAGVIKDSEAKIVGIQEGPPRKEQLEAFVQEFLDNDYVVHHSNENWQSICALVHNSIAEQVEALDPAGDELAFLRSNAWYYPWGKIQKEDRKKHRFARVPLVLKYRPSAGKELTLIVVHTKSKYSKLKTKEQWEERDEEAVLDALEAREKLSAEVLLLRRYIERELAAPQQDRALAVMGDFNDGPYVELMEQEFLVHNIIDELCGSLLTPQTYLDHAMDADVLGTAKTVRFPDPVEDGAMVEELVDHILVSPGIWQNKSAFGVKAGSCQVESEVYELYNDDHDEAKPQRGLRPSDHKPVSVVFQYA